MDFLYELKSRGFSEKTISVMENEGISSKSRFVSLRPEHFSLLLPKLQIGYALVMVDRK